MAAGNLPAEMIATASTTTAGPVAGGHADQGQVLFQRRDSDGAHDAAGAAARRIPEAAAQTQI